MTAITTNSMNDFEAYEERAAIREYEGKMSRYMAEKLARQDLERMKKPQRELFEYGA